MQHIPRQHFIEKSGCFLLPLLRPLCVGCCMYLIILHAVTFGDTKALRSWRLCCFMSLTTTTHLSTKHGMMFLKAFGMILAVFDMQHPTSSSLKCHYANCLPVCSVEINRWQVKTEIYQVRDKVVQARRKDTFNLEMNVSGILHVRSSPCKGLSP